MQALRTSRARFHWRRFRIDDAGHGDADGVGDDRTVQIRFSSVPESMVDALHGIRAVERHFGRIRDYRLLRDSEICSEYQALCWAAFDSPTSLRYLPPKGTTLKVPLPPPLGHPEGGPGLGDLAHLFEPEGNAQSGSPGQNKPARFVVLNIKRADGPIAFRNTIKPPFRSRSMKAAIGHGFLEWGGFASLEPLYTSSPFSSSAENVPPLDSKYMRMALNKWSQILGVPDPLFPEMKQVFGDAETREKDAQSDWEPLSEPLWKPGGADVAEEFKAPRSAQESLRESLESVLQRNSDEKA